jgi:hypothetical protein|tara:strand:+ start:373 stop:504 length:132 start_codon:yes stop_codon:yes gene_type:complete
MASNNDSQNSEPLRALDEFKLYLNNPAEFVERLYLAGDNYLVS